MLTELQAVNQLLGTIRESPVNSLEVPLSGEALTARNVLDEVSLEVQRIGWSFNIERDVTLQKDGNGNINLASDVIRIEVDPAVRTKTFDPVARGARLYNRGTNSYTWASNVKCRRLYRKLPWDSLPDTARQYIVERASRIFANRTSGSEKLERDASIEEMRALRELRREHGETERPNILNSPGIAPVAYRDTDYV